MNVIRILWDNLGVSEYYIHVFETVINDLESTIRRDFIEFEITCLKRVNDQLLVITINIRNYQEK